MTERQEKDPPRDDAKAPEGRFRFVIPNLITAANLLLGTISILLCVCGMIYWAGWLIMLSVLLDKLDGTCARKLSASSRFGVEFDSLADLVAFGVAPAAFVYSTLAGPADIAAGAVQRTLLAVACVVYVLAAAIRLARFNVESTEGGAEVYFGVAMPMAAGLVTALLLTLLKYSALPLGYTGWQGDIDLLVGWQPSALWFDWFAIWVLVMAALMVSNLKVPKPKPTGRRAMDIYLIVNVALTYILIPLRMFPAYLWLVALQYLVISLIYTFFYPSSRRHQIRPFLDTLALPPISPAKKTSDTSEQHPPHPQAES